MYLIISLAFLLALAAVTAFHAVLRAWAAGKDIAAPRSFSGEGRKRRIELSEQIEELSEQIKELEEKLEDFPGAGGGDARARRNRETELHNLAVYDGTEKGQLDYEE